MEIMVNMTPEEFDQFRAFQKEKASLEREIGEAFDGLRQRHDTLCFRICKGIERDDVSGELNSGAGISGECFTIKDKNALSGAIDLANDWFC